MEEPLISRTFCSAGETKSLFDDLSAYPQPRMVKLTDFCRTLWATCTVGWVVLTALLAVSGMRIARSGYFDFELLFWSFLFPLLSGAALFITVASEFRDRDLLRNGALVLGEVTAQRKVGRRGTLIMIRYKFKDSSGALYQGESQDHSKSYFTGAPVPVFYDPSDPERNVAICSVYSRIVSRGGPLVPRE
jgi:hypothetical protein